jgi:hypothetical protein
MIKVLLNSFTFFNTHLCLTLCGLSPDSVHTHFLFLPVSGWLMAVQLYFSHCGKVKMYELSKLPYFYYLVNPL